MAVDNKEILNTIRNEASAEYKEKIPEATAENQKEILETLSTYETVMNEFINSLTNRIMKTMFFNKIWNNPLKPLHKGQMPLGYTIQQIFVDMAERKGLYENFGDSPEKSLLGKTVPQVHEKFISKNFRYKYKVSISEEQLADAFVNETGLNNLCTNILNANIRRAYLDEYNDMKGILTRPQAVNQGGAKFDKGVIPRVVEHTNLKSSAVVQLPKDFNANLLAEKIKSQVKKMSFITDKFNLAEVDTFTDTDKMCIFTTPDYEAKLDVNTLAFAFNIDKANVPGKMIILDDIPNIQIDSTNYKVVAVLADEDLIQQWETLNKTKQFDNGDNLIRNVWLHRHGICASCDFAQVCLIVEPV